MKENTKDKIGIVSAIVVAVLLFAAPFVWSAPVNIPIKFHYGSVQDEIVVQKRAFDVSVSSFTKTNVASVDTVMSFGDDTLWQVVAWNRSAPQPLDSGSTWTIQINRRSSNGPIPWRIDAGWAEPTDSVRWKFYKDTVVALSFKTGTELLFDSSFTLYRDTAYSLIGDIYYLGNPNPTSWLWNCLWRRIDTGAFVSSPSATLCRFFGFIKLPNGNPAKGAVVIVSRSAPSNSVSTTTTRYGITADVVSVRTDSSGKFQQDVIASSQFSDTANAYYDVKAMWRGIELFNLRHLWAPAGVTLNVMDSLAAR